MQQNDLKIILAHRLTDSRTGNLEGMRRRHFGTVQYSSMIYSSTGARGELKMITFE